LQIKPLGDQLELGSDNIYFLQFDGGANLWVGTESGVDKIMLNDFRTPIEIQHFGKQEGLLGIETCTNASIRDRENNLWFGTIDGLAKADPNLHVRNPFPPRTRITQINLFYEPLSSTSLASFVGDWGQVNDTLVLTYTQNHLSFDFLGVDHLDPEGVRYQWQLFGEETAWSPLTSQTRATFSNLRPGEYSFRHDLSPILAKKMVPSSLCFGRIDGHKPSILFARSQP
jgi:hypothetical protein